MNIKKFWQFLKLSVVALGIQGGAAYAGTINITDTWSINSGIYSGKQLVLNYSYAELAPGYTPIQLFGYSPVVTGTATFLGLTSSALSSSQLIFTGSQDMYNPESYLTFQFAPNFSGIKTIDVWNLGGFGVFLAGASGILTQCGSAGPCDWSRSVSVTPSAVPLPAGGLLLGFPLVLGGLAARRRARKSAAA